MKKRLAGLLATLIICAYVMSLAVEAKAEKMVVTEPIDAKSKLVDDMWWGLNEDYSLGRYLLVKPALDRRAFCTHIFKGTYPPRELWDSMKNPVSSAVEERVKAWKANEKMRQAVAEDAPDPEAWWAWLESLPVDSTVTLGQKEVLEWLEVYADCTREGRDSFNRNYLYAAETPSRRRGIEMLDRT